MAAWDAWPRVTWIVATLNVPAIGYGLRYEFGIFDQVIVMAGGWNHRQVAPIRQPLGDRAI